MPKSIKPSDFATLALSLAPILENHKVAPESRASLIEDLIFHFAVFIDERTGSEFHESVFGVLRSATPEPSDHPVAELQILFDKGARAEMIISRVSLRKTSILRMNLEVALGVRDVTEIRSRIDSKRRFSDLMRKKGGIKALRFNSATRRGKPSWVEIRLPDSPYGSFERSLDGVMSCIKAVSAQWV
jgi:hypothetical protein